jgi:hypothetical protein
MSFSAGSIVSTMGINVSPFATGMLQAQGIAQLFPTVVANFIASPLLGVIDIAMRLASAIKSAFTTVASAADDMGELAERTGVSVQFLSVMGRVAQDAGASTEGLADALKFLNNNAADAAAGNKTTAKAFADLGIGVTDSAGQIKSAESLFYEVADAIAALPSAAEKTQAAMNLMGRGGTQMIPMLNQGGSEIRKFGAILDAAGGGIDANLARQGDAWGKLTTIASAAWFGIQKAIATPIMAAVEEQFGSMQNVVLSVMERIKPALGQIGETIAANLPQIIEFGVAFVTGVIDVLRMAAPYASSFMDLVMSLGTAIGSVLGPALRVILPILHLILAVMKAIMAVVGPLLEMIGSVVDWTVSGIGDLLGLGGSDTAAIGSVAGGSFNRSSGGGSTAAGTNINIQQLTVPPVNYNEASSAIAGALQPKLRQAIEQQNRQLQSAAGLAAVKAGL